MSAPYYRRLVRVRPDDRPGRRQSFIHDAGP